MSPDSKFAAGFGLQEVLLEGFRQFLFGFMHRDCNMVAHLPAKEGLRRGGSTYLSGGMLDFAKIEMERDQLA
ncbi:hypothetical protein Gogos_020538 [Gossypium gossypioides]|uniref:Uncharacterized protein n=1 Tax=Gossypium gossypioides TaxID=34282 RepID=A0A7J9D761_GOSGO|nr:hypothetical protein [Gossypium gossypioides]